MSKNKNALINIVFKIGAILIVLAAVCYSFDTTVASYMMIVGAVFYIISVFTSRYSGPSLRGKRLYNINVFGAIATGVAAYLMYIQDLRWALALFIAAILTLYANYMLDKVIKKDQQQ